MITLKDMDSDDVIDRVINILFDDDDKVTSSTAEVLTVTTPPLNVEAVYYFPQKVIVWFSGGVVGTTYSIDFFINTANGRRINDTLQMKVIAR